MTFAKNCQTALESGLKVVAWRPLWSPFCPARAQILGLFCTPRLSREICPKLPNSTGIGLKVAFLEPFSASSNPDTRAIWHSSAAARNLPKLPNSPRFWPQNGRRKAFLESFLVPFRAQILGLFGALSVVARRVPKNCQTALDSGLKSGRPEAFLEPCSARSGPGTRAIWHSPAVALHVPKTAKQP